MGVRKGGRIASGPLGLVIWVALAASPRAALAQVAGQPAGSSVTPVAQAVPVSPDDLAAMEARVQALEREVDQTKALVAEVGLTPARAPAGVPGRFKQQAVLEAVRLAFRQVNPRAELLGIDCDDYPCIAYGSGLNQEQLGQLKYSPALAGYAQDSVSTFSWSDVVAVIPTPKNDPNLGNDSEQRILVRFHRLVTARHGSAAASVN